MTGLCANKEQNADDQHPNAVRRLHNGFALLDGLFTLRNGSVGNGIGCDGHKEEIAHSQNATDDNAQYYLIAKLSQQGKHADDCSRANKLAQCQQRGFP